MLRITFASSDHHIQLNHSFPTCAAFPAGVSMRVEPNCHRVLCPSLPYTWEFFHDLLFHLGKERQFAEIHPPTRILSAIHWGWGKREVSCFHSTKCSTQHYPGTILGLGHSAGCKMVAVLPSPQLRGRASALHAEGSILSISSRAGNFHCLKPLRLAATQCWQYWVRWAGGVGSFLYS